METQALVYNEEHRPKEKEFTPKIGFNVKFGLFQPPFQFLKFLNADYYTKICTK